MRRALRIWLAIALAVVLAGGTVAARAPVARADGDPGSDVLVNQDLFVAADAGLTIAQQAKFGDQLQAATQAGFPIRVAIIASPADLGTVTQLWRKPQPYADYLGIELSLAYTGRLLVVMPNGFGVNWPGHATAAAVASLGHVPILAGPTGLLAATQDAVHTLAAAAGVKLAVGSAPTASGTAGAAGGAIPTGGGSFGNGAVSASAGSSGSASGQSTDQTVTIVVLALVALAVIGFVIRRALARRAAPVTRPRRALPAAAVLFGVAALTPVVILGAIRSSDQSQPAALASNPYVDPGTTVAGPAANFTLSDQFGQPVSLRSFRSKVVMLAFTDSECTTICPMTTTAMLAAKAMLGSAASRVQLLGVDANPASTSLEDVYSYSQLHGMLHQWQFMTGTLAQLERVWKSYAVYADIQRGLIAHTPALYLIGPTGEKAKVYITQQSYSSVGQLSQVLADEASRLLPGHPAVHSDLSYRPIPAISPADHVTLPRAGGGTVALGPGTGAAPHLYVFFATWDREITGLSGDLTTLDEYQSTAAARGLPSLTAVDEGTVEPTRQALPDFLSSLARPLSYPVAIDASGRVADGYDVLGQPWFVLTSAAGKILWYWQVSTSGWPSNAKLAADVRAALSRAPGAQTSSAGVVQELAGSPAPLAALHQQASRLLGSDAALTARIKALRGYPIVINAWASWCTPCREEFNLFANASATYGRKVAFLGADTDDSPGDAQAFLSAHHVSYPSYQANSSQLGSLAVVQNLPTTIFLNASGKMVYVHIGQYDSQGTLDNDIETYYSLSG